MFIFIRIDPLTRHPCSRQTTDDKNVGGFVFIKEWHENRIHDEKIKWQSHDK